MLSNFVLYIFPRRLDPFHEVTYNIKCFETAWAYGVKHIPAGNLPNSKLINNSLSLWMVKNRFLFPCDPVCLISPKSPIRIMRLESAILVLHTRPNQTSQPNQISSRISENLKSWKFRFFYKTSQIFTWMISTSQNILIICQRVIIIDEIVNR